MTINRIQT